jgi:hypothetical protein
VDGCYDYGRDDVVEIDLDDYQELRRILEAEGFGADLLDPLPLKTAAVD